MTKSEKRIVEYAELVEAATAEENPRVQKILLDALSIETQKVLKEYRKKEKTDGRKSKKATAPAASSTDGKDSPQ